MKLFYSEHFQQRLTKRLIKNPQLTEKVTKQLKLLEVSYQHPSLRTHKLKGDRGTEFAIWIEGNLRAIFVLVEEGILLTDIITHDEY